MKARCILFALGALLAGNAFAANPFSIYFNTVGPSSCSVSNVTNINVLPDGNILATTSPATPVFVNLNNVCGVSGVLNVFSIGGSVSGQTGAFTLAVTAGSQTVNVSSSASSYTFPTQVATGTNYTVSVQTPPAGQTCSVANATGTIGNSNVTNANVTCTTTGVGPFTIGGNVSGLTASGLVMAVTAGNQTKTVASGASSYVFPTAVASGTGYTVSVQTQPAGLTCSVVNPTGTANANVTNANVSCVTIGIPVNCTQGQTGDVPGYTAICNGSYKFHTGGQDSNMGPSAYSFKFVFGDNQNQWPGGPFGTSQIFTTGVTNFMAIPFKPSPGHTIQIVEGQSWTAHPITFSVSTQPGLFNNGKAGNNVICAATNNPALKLSSNGSTTSQCVLDPNTVYWFNIIPAHYSTSQGKWVTEYTGASAQFATTVYSIN